LDSTFRNSFYIGCTLAVFVGFWLAHLWSGPQQVQLHSQNFIRQVEKRDILGAGNFVAAEYHDDWGNDRALLLSRLRLVVGSFSLLKINADEPDITLTPPDASWRAKLQISGSGPELATEINVRVNSLVTPFEFRWRKKSWKPWDWKLFAIRNPSLQIPDT
jgi:hypothetical protein